MTITQKAQVDKVIGAYKSLVARKRKDIVAAQEAAEALATKERAKTKPPTT